MPSLLDTEYGCVLAGRFALNSNVIRQCSGLYVWKSQCPSWKNDRLETGTSWGVQNEMAVQFVGWWIILFQSAYTLKQLRGYPKKAAKHFWYAATCGRTLLQTVAKCSVEDTPGGTAILRPELFQDCHLPSLSYSCFSKYAGKRIFWPQNSVYLLVKFELKWNNGLCSCWCYNKLVSSKIPPK